MRRGALHCAAVALAALGAVACSKQPARPHLVLVTVDGLPAGGLGDVPFLRQLAEQCVRFEDVELPGASTFDALAVMHSGRSLDALAPAEVGALRPPGGVGAPLTGGADTWMERALPRGFETAAIVSAEGLGVESGLMQGAVHRLDATMLDARATDETVPLVQVALDAAADFLDRRMARSVEHGAVLWLHFDLAELAPTERGPFLDGALARVSAALESDPRHVLACWFLPSDDALGAAAPLWLRVRGEQPRDERSGALPRDIAPTLAALLGVPAQPPAQPPFEPFEGRDLLQRGGASEATDG